MENPVVELQNDFKSVLLSDFLEIEIAQTTIWFMRIFLFSLILKAKV